MYHLVELAAELKDRFRLVVEAWEGYYLDDEPIEVAISHLESAKDMLNVLSHEVAKATLSLARLSAKAPTSRSEVVAKSAGKEGEARRVGSV